MKKNEKLSNNLLLAVNSCKVNSVTGKLPPVKFSPGKIVLQQIIPWVKVRVRIRVGSNLPESDFPGATFYVPFNRAVFSCYSKVRT